MATSLPDGTWKSWFEAYGAKLVLFARQWATSAADAEDIVQEAFVRFWRSPYRNDAEAHVQLFAMVRRVGLDEIRRKTRRERRERRSLVGEESVAWFRTPEGLDESGESVQRALALLAEDQREVVVLKVWGELTYEQIGRSLGISPNTAASRYRYAIEAMRRQFSLSIP